jgi:hypothetical protein
VDQDLARLLAAVAIVAIAAGSSRVIRTRRASDPPTQVTKNIPSQLDRADFPEARAPWLVTVFTSASCSTCAAVLDKSVVLRSDDVDVVDVEYTTRGDLHRRYSIDAVPTLLIADATGEVQAAFVGPVTATDLWAAVAECREPGSVHGGDADCAGGRVDS